ncbi:MAG: DUF2569 domain-containing protein [Pseudomonadales bacterium]|nr:DUF2569 domain-containing protein [Pseudomonadales bacterium]
MNEESDLKGLRGWLILIGLGLVFSPIRLVATCYPLFSQIFTDGTWEIVTTQGSEFYHPIWAPLLIGELIFNVGLVLLCLYLMYLFFTRAQLFPKVYIFMMVISFVFILFDAWISTIVLPDEPMFDPDTTKGFINAIIGVIVWVPYMLVSRRVKATFVEPVANQVNQPTIEQVG